MALTETDVNRIRRVIPRWAALPASAVLLGDGLIFFLLRSPLPLAIQILLAAASAPALAVLILEGLTRAAPFPRRDAR